ncbi:MAG: nuclease [Gemmatimonadetes bacterium]|nr:MAG: nuclease [Gemmatimonadota bacterium]
MRSTTRWAIGALAAVTVAGTGATAFWGRTGHLLVGRAAAAHLPADMPDFFREAAPRLSYLNYEPDRWRSRDHREMDEAFKYDHYIDLENVPDSIRAAPDRFVYLTRLFRETDLAHPERDAGFLPFRILELYERMLTGFERWRAVEDPEERAWIEARILNDAGVLGHYVADGAQPHHTTIHFNGWSQNAPNPRGFTTSNDFHWRFESLFVDAAVDPERVVAVARLAAPRRLPSVRAAVWDYLLQSNLLVERLYELEQSDGFDPNAPTDATRAFAEERLAAGARMLRDLWWTAWVESGAPDDDEQGAGAAPQEPTGPGV